jgi:hypothetical protein
VTDTNLDNRFPNARRPAGDVRTMRIRDGLSVYSTTNRELYKSIALADEHTWAAQLDALDDTQLLDVQRMAGTARDVWLRPHIDQAWRRRRDAP